MKTGCNLLPGIAETRPEDSLLRDVPFGFVFRLFLTLPRSLAEESDSCGVPAENLGFFLGLDIDFVNALFSLKLKHCIGVLCSEGCPRFDGFLYEALYMLGVCVPDVDF